MSSVFGFIKELTEKDHTPTPSYVFDLDKMKGFVKKVQSCLGESVQLCYAMKANPFLTGPMMEVVSSFEVCSPGEFRICERVGVPMLRPQAPFLLLQLSYVCHSEDSPIRYLQAESYTLLL